MINSCIHRCFAASLCGSSTASAALPLQHLPDGAARGHANDPYRLGHPLAGDAPGAAVLSIPAFAIGRWLYAGHHWRRTWPALCLSCGAGHAAGSA